MPSSASCSGAHRSPLALAWCGPWRWRTSFAVSPVCFLDALQEGLPGVNAGSLVASLGAATLDQSGGTPGVTAAVSGSQAVAVLIAYVVAMALIAVIVLRRQDVR